MIRLLIALCLMLPAAARELAPGVYLTEGGWGTLVLSRATSGTTRFTIETIGANGHSCSLVGEVHDGKATLEALDEDSTCVVTFTAGADRVTVDGDRDACRAYCGARAGFNATYFRPAPACAPKALARARKNFQSFYERGKYAEARSTLAPLLTTCDRWLDPVTEGWIRNDLAVTLHKLRDFAGCRALLDPLAEEASLSEEELRELYPPSDAESRMPLLRATRTNLKLCRE